MLVCRGVFFTAIRAKASNLYLNFFSEHFDQLSYMHTGATVNGWWVFFADQIDSHIAMLVSGQIY